MRKLLIFALALSMVLPLMAKDSKAGTMIVGIRTYDHIKTTSNDRTLLVNFAHPNWSTGSIYCVSPPGIEFKYQGVLRGKNLELSSSKWVKEVDAMTTENPSTEKKIEDPAQYPIYNSCQIASGNDPYSGITFQIAIYEDGGTL